MFCNHKGIDYWGYKFSKRNYSFVIKPSQYYLHQHKNIKSATAANTTDDATKNDDAREKRLAQFLK